MLRDQAHVITRQTYDRIAPAFAARTAEMPPSMAAALEQLLQWAGPNARVLDVGCGPGRDSAWLQAHGAAVVSADLSAGMLALARQAGLPRPAQMDMLNLGLQSASFQAVWCNAALLHLPKAAAPLALAEMQRVLAPGGVLFLGMQEGDVEQMEPCPYVEQGGDRLFARYTLAELRALLEAHGLAIIETSRDLNGARTWLHVLVHKGQENRRENP